MFATIHSSCIAGIEAVSVDVEVNVRSGTPRFSIIGMGGAAIRESRERILSALEYTGFDTPGQILVNLAPAEVKKESAAFDLPIAVAILVAMGVIDPVLIKGTVMCGELSLTGEVKATPGIIAHALVALHTGKRRIIVPAVNAEEAAVLNDLEVVPVGSLTQLLRILRGDELPSIPSSDRMSDRGHQVTLNEVIGQRQGKRALAIAAAGGHNLLMVGPPGCGKSMLAERLPSLLTPLSVSEKLEVVKIHSIAGQATHSLLAGVRPFRAPHHVISDAGLIGGGSGPRPGEISLAHRGVLFLDEFPEFRRGVLEALRSPLETGSVQLSRARGAIRYPSRFQLVAAMNPCPCGLFGARRGGCRCSHHAVREYVGRLSQPILDRIDLHVQLHALPVEELMSNQRNACEEQDFLEGQIAMAHEQQMRRFGCLNSEVADGRLRESGQVAQSATRLLLEAAQQLGMSARGVCRILRVARTIADMGHSEQVMEEAVAEAISYRWLERFRNVIHEGHSMGRGGIVRQ